MTYADDPKELYCPFSRTGECPSMPVCPNNRERACVNGEED